MNPQHQATPVAGESQPAPKSPKSAPKLNNLKTAAWKHVNPTAHLAVLKKPGHKDLLSDAYLVPSNNSSDFYITLLQKKLESHDKRCDYGLEDPSPLGSLYADEICILEKPKERAFLEDLQRNAYFRMELSAKEYTRKKMEKRMEAIEPERKRSDKLIGEEMEKDGLSVNDWDDSRNQLEDAKVKLDDAKERLAKRQSKEAIESDKTNKTNPGTESVPAPQKQAVQYYKATYDDDSDEEDEDEDDFSNFYDYGRTSTTNGPPTTPAEEQAPACAVPETVQASPPTGTNIQIPYSFAEFEAYLEFVLDGTEFRKERPGLTYAREEFLDAVAPKQEYKMRSHPCILTPLLFNFKRKEYVDPAPIFRSSIPRIRLITPAGRHCLVDVPDHGEIRPNFDDYLRNRDAAQLNMKRAREFWFYENREAAIDFENRVMKEDILKGSQQFDKFVEEHQIPYPDLTQTTHTKRTLPKTTKLAAIPEDIPQTLPKVTKPATIPKEIPRKQSIAIRICLQRLRNCERKLARATEAHEKVKDVLFHKTKIIRQGISMAVERKIESLMEAEKYGYLRRPPAKNGEVTYKTERNLRLNLFKVIHQKGRIRPDHANTMRLVSRSGKEKVRFVGRLSTEPRFRQIITGSEAITKLAVKTNRLEKDMLKTKPEHGYWDEVKPLATIPRTGRLRRRNMDERTTDITADAIGKMRRGTDDGASYNKLRRISKEKSKQRKEVAYEHENKSIDVLEEVQQELIEGGRKSLKDEAAKVKNIRRPRKMRIPAEDGPGMNAMLESTEVSEDDTNDTEAEIKDSGHGQDNVENAQSTTDNHITIRSETPEPEARQHPAKTSPDELLVKERKRSLEGTSTAPVLKRRKSDETGYSSSLRTPLPHRPCSAAHIPE